MTQDINQQVAEARSVYEALQAEDTAIRQRMHSIRSELAQLQARETEINGPAMSMGGGLLRAAQRTLQRLEQLQKDSSLATFQVVRDGKTLTLAIDSCTNRYVYCREAGTNAELMLDRQTNTISRLQISLTDDEKQGLKAAIKQHKERK